MYDGSVDCYAAVVMAMSRRLGGWSALCAVAEQVPAGASQQQRTLAPWLYKVNAGLEQPRLALSKEMRDWVGCGIQPGCTPERLLAHAWMTGMDITDQLAAAPGQQHRQLQCWHSSSRSCRADGAS
jgi:hypothetical protein